MTDLPVIQERKKPFKDWTDMSGIYADLRHYPNSVNYYAECPGCHQIRDGFKTMRDAVSQRVCPQCSVEQINQIKKQVRQVVNEPEKNVKPLAAIVREAGPDEPPIESPNEPEDDSAPDMLAGGDPWNVINDLLQPNWMEAARRQLSFYLSLEDDDVTIIPDLGDYDEDNPDAVTEFEVKAKGEEWTIFKDSDVAEAKALERVRSDLEGEPEVFSQEWLQGYIDEDRLKEAIGDPNEDYGDDVRDLDYTEKLERMVEEDRVENDDPVFFKKNGEPRIENAARSRQLDGIVDTWIEETKPELDPWEWLEDCYGKDKAAAEALKMVGFDVDKAAQDAVNMDGWQHFLASYDGNSVDLPDGPVAIRTN